MYPQVFDAANGKSIVNVNQHSSVIGRTNVGTWRAMSDCCDDYASGNGTVFNQTWHALHLSGKESSALIKTENYFEVFSFYSNFVASLSSILLG